MARPVGVKQKKNENKYILPEGVTLKATEEYYTKETKLIFIDSTYGEFISSFKAIIDAGHSLHPKAKSKRKSENNPGATPLATLKRKQTIKEKYGVEHALQNKDLLNKARNTLFNNYGANHPMDKEEFREKQRQTTYANYGVYYPGQSEELKQKIKSTNLERYGVDNPSKSPKIQEKILDAFEKKGYEGMVSGGELELKTFIESLGFKTRQKKVGGAKSFKIDIFIDELQFGIEYNGGYWHRHDLKKNKNYHYDKTRICKEKGIKLIHIFDYNWIHRKDQCKGILKSLLHKNSIKVFARKCEIALVNKDDANKFLNDNHLLGSVIHSSAFGLKYNGELVSLVTFNKHHRGLNQLVLNRFCCKNDVSVVGGLSKLCNYAKHALNSEFYTFIDLTMATETNWVKTGWEVVSQSAPDYFYYSSNGSRYISKQSMKDKENNIPKGIYKVYDCGKVKLKYV